MQSNSELIERSRFSMINHANSDFTVTSFFAGIGGFDLGFHRAGFRTVFQCEINTYCNSVLRRHWPTVPSVLDISQVEPESIPDADVWCGGFPCQDVSVARGWLGRDGLKGKNTGLFFPFMRLIEARQPRVVLLENVTGLLNSHDGRDFAVVLQSLQELGYGVAWRVMNTRYFGAPQSRPRVYICAWLSSVIEACKTLFEPGLTFHPENQRLGFLRSSNCPTTSAYVPEVSYCLAATSGRHTGTDWSRSYVSYRDEVRRLTPTECERLQGFPDDWTLPNGDFHLTDDEIDSLRYHAIGNAVSVPVIEWIARRIRRGLASNAKTNADAPDFFASVWEVGKRVPDFTLKKAKYIELTPFIARDEAPPVRWSSGGVGATNRCLMAPVSSAPNPPIMSRFVDVLDRTRPDARYFLSPNAAIGILRRVKSQKRELFKPLQDALELLAQSSE